MRAGESLSHMRCSTTGCGRKVTRYHTIDTVTLMLCDMCAIYALSKGAKTKVIPHG